MNSNVTRKQIAEAAAEALHAAADRVAGSPVVVGFDGFVDSIIDVVDQRQDLQRYEAMATIERFGQKILDAAGQSSNYELVTTLEKLGGNGPIMANAMAAAGLPTTYIGALGYPALHPVFESFATHAECISFSEPGLTDALEFSDGKLLLGKHSALRGVNAERVEAVVGVPKLSEVVGQARLLSMVNWTMLTNMNTIWDLLVEKVLPGLGDPITGRRMIFIDLADPEKRTRADLAEALAYGKRFQQYADVVFGFNLKEATQAAEVLGVTVSGNAEAVIEATAVALRDALGVYAVVVHPRSGAAAAMLTTSGVTAAHFAGPLVKKPKLSTGAGDNFNAGFCLGLIAGLSLDQSLCTGTATSGYYVRNAASPSLDQLVEFCRNLPDPE
ncbi:MAG: PfkB family carbohydrate kinase [Verrucomicrobia bacterium]|nr:PfkB family carbohydrate kinase [Verrucomicrobiota bacterium]